MTDTDDDAARRRAVALQRQVERTRTAYDKALAERDGFFLENSAEHGGIYSHSALGRMAGGLPSMTVGRAVLAAIRRATQPDGPIKRNPGGAGRHRTRHDGAESSDVTV